MRRAARTDANQTAIITGLQAAGCSVQSLAQLGAGCPDLLVGYRGKNFLIEVKDGSKSPSERRLTSFQLHWISLWRGQFDVAESLDDALRIVNAI